MTNMNDTTATTPMNGVELLETLQITRTTRRPAVRLGCPEDQGVWVDGTIGGHRFQALVWPDHADDASYELSDSRITKFWLQRLSDRKTVASFDRGWDAHPQTTEAQQIVDLLAAGLAEHVLA